ncbi:MAG: hypothetical protein ACRD15_18295, partial [Vicinamibacterales bacterium]
MAAKSSGWRLLLALILIVMAIGIVDSVTLGAQQPPRTADEAFVPIDELPPGETLPAAPFLIAAYSVAWV